MIEDIHIGTLVGKDSYAKARESDIEVDSDFNDGWGSIDREFVEMWYGGNPMTDRMRRYLFPTAEEIAESLGTTLDRIRELNKTMGETDEEVLLTKKKIKQMIKSAKRTGNYMEVKKLERMYSECKL